MKPEEIEFELTTLLRLGNRNLTKEELTAIRCAIPKIVKCEKYRRALSMVQVMMQTDSFDRHKVLGVIEKAFDMEEA